jgi:hypothetical protein
MSTNESATRCCRRNGFLRPERLFGWRTSVGSSQQWRAKRYRLLFSKSRATLRRAYTCACDFFAYASAKQMGGWSAFVASRQDPSDAFSLFSASVSPTSAICNGLLFQTITCSSFAGNFGFMEFV